MAGDRIKLVGTDLLLLESGDYLLLTPTDPQPDPGAGSTIFSTAIAGPPLDNIVLERQAIVRPHHMQKANKKND